MHAFSVLSAITVIALAAVPSSLASNITITTPNAPFVPSGSLPASQAATHSEEIIKQFNNLGRTTVWKLVEKVHLQGETWEPEGMVRIGDDRYFVSAGEYTSPTVKFPNNSIINGTDRSAGSGFAHLIVFDGNGTRIADATLTSRGAIEYHNGGLDYDGRYIWATIAQYRPNSTATIYKIDPRTLEATTILHADDHLGGIVHDTETDQLVTLNWGARNASTWNLKRKIDPTANYTKPLAVRRNPSYYTDYQDCKYLGHSHVYQGRGIMMCSGVTSLGSAIIGGLALVDEESMIPLAEVPLTMVSDLGVLVTQNPMDVSIVNGRLRVYFIPDQHNSTLYVYEAEAQSPYEY